MSVESVSFHVLAPEDVLRLSVREITKISLHKKGQPHASGPNSLFLGSTSNEFVCATCGRRPDQCTGHTGHVSLQRRIAHPLYVGTLLKLLRTVCLACCEPLANKGKCPLCGAKKQDVLVKKGVRILRCGKAMTGDDIWEILEAAGVEKACGLVLEHLLIPPVMIRPSVAKVSGSKLRGQDDLTMALVNIIRANRKIREADAAGDAEEAARQEEALGYYIACYMVRSPSRVAALNSRSPPPLPMHPSPIQPPRTRNLASTGSRTGTKRAPGVRPRSKVWLSGSRARRGACGVTSCTFF